MRKVDMTLILVKMFILIFFCDDIFAQVIEQKEQDIKVYFNDSAARYVLENPVNALYNRDNIWNTFEGYRITQVWHEKSNYPISWEIWEKGLQKFVNNDSTLIRKSLDLIDNIDAVEKREHEKIVQHLSYYLPKTAAFNAYVYFVAFTIPYAFCVEQNKIGVDVSADEWHFEPNCLLNMIIHEIYHVGYKLNSPDKEYINADPINNIEFIRFNYAYMLSEGMATYVAYKALDIFPSDYMHEDYILLKEEKNVINAISNINILLEKAKTAKIDSLLKQAWEIGVSQRAYYIAGANVCRIIEEKFGGEYLSKLVLRGGAEIIKEYNALVAEDSQIYLVKY